MARRTWTAEDEVTARAMAAQGKSDGQIGRVLGRSANSVSTWRTRNGVTGGRVIRDAPESQPEQPTDEFTREGDGEKEHLTSRSTRIKTLDDLLAYAEVDTRVWEVERYTVNKWELGAKLKQDGEESIVVEPLFQVKAWLRRNRAACVLRAIGDEIITSIESRRPTWEPTAPAVLSRLKERHLYEVCMMDLHVGKLAWSEETGEDYDIGIAEDVFKEALETLIGSVQGRCIEQVLFPIGNDLFHFDNLQQTTTGGTPQDSDTRYAKVYARAEGMMWYALDRLSQIAPVTAPIVPGNHDRQSALSLGRTLRAWFHGNDRVSVDVSPRLRKYHRYGVNLIGYTHGSEEKPADLPLLMAQERPQDWAETMFREWHIGHLHRSRETRYTAGDTFNGVRVRICPALCATDAWHAQKGYVGGVRSAESFLWNRETGYAGQFAANVLPADLAA